MRRLWPNLDGEEGLETVLEVPLPDEMFGSNSHNFNSWRTVKSWLTRPHHQRTSSQYFQTRALHIQFFLGLIGAPFIPLPISSHHHNTKPHPIERSMALYIVQQYIAASGGQHVLNAIESMCVIGKVKMAASEMVGGEDLRVGKMKSMKQGAGELGGFVLWQKRPHLWSLELMLSGFKISAASDGALAWRQSPSRVSRGPARPLRRSLQGLDPRATADLFSNSICIGEKTINGEDCFVLKLEAEARSSSSSSLEIMKHTVSGCFSQRTGLLVHLEDCHSLRTKPSPTNQLLWETRIESLIQDYRTIDGVNIAHAGRTTVLSFRYGDDAENQTRTRMEEVWSIEEVDFNVKGLSTDCFLPPADLNKEDQEYDCDAADDDDGGLRYKVSTKICGSRSGTKVVAIDEESLEVYNSDDDDEL